MRYSAAGTYNPLRKTEVMSEFNDPATKTLWEAATTAFPGFVGSVVTAIYFTRPASKAEAAGGILAGTLTSVFVAPLIAQLVAPNVPSAYSGIGFCTGVVTVALVPAIIHQIRNLITQLDWGLIKTWFQKK
jgi:hypothetical protein